MPQTINNMVQEWVNSLTTYTAIKMNIPTDVSAAGSLLMDLQVGGSSRFNVSKAGRVFGVQSADNATPTFSFVGRTTDGIANPNGQIYFVRGGTAEAKIAGGLTLSSASILRWTISTIDSGDDLFLTRRAAANLRLGAADAAGSAIAISSVASNQLTLASAHGLTTGAAIIITGTAAPSGTTLNVRYYARVIAAAVIELYSTYDQATAASGTTGIIAVTTAGTTASVRLATPFQSFGVQDFTGTDIPGQPFIIRGSRGTGTGPGGDLIFQVAPAGTTGSAQNALATALTIDSTQKATFAAGADFTGAINALSALNVFGTRVYLDGSGVFVSNGRYYGFTGSEQGGTVDTRLYRDTTNTLALRNGGTNAAPVSQQFNVYKFWADASNYSRLEVGNAADGNTHYLYATHLGTGTARDLLIGTSGAKSLLIYTNGGQRWFVDSNGHLLAGSVGAGDNTYDIGASGANRPRTGYFGTKITAAGAGELGANYVGGINNTLISFTSSSVASLQPYNGPGDVRLQFGGTTSSFPALKRNSTALETKLADDSAYAPHAMQYLDVTDGITAPASATGRARIYVDTADGDLKVIFADGTVKTIVTDT